MRVIPERHLRHAKPRPRHIVGILYVNGFFRSGLPEEGLDQQRADFLDPTKLGASEGLGLGLELLEGVELAALPHLLLDGEGAAASRPELLVPGGEDGSGGAGGGGMRFRVVGGGGKGAVEVGKDELLGGPGERGDDLADAEGGGLALDTRDKGDGISELRLGGVVLGRQGQVLQPCGDLRGVGHGGGEAIPGPRFPGNSPRKEIRQGSETILGAD